MTLFKTIAKNIHDMCIVVSERDCNKCVIQDKKNKICPYEYIFGSMPCDWIFEDDKKR